MKQLTAFLSAVLMMMLPRPADAQTAPDAAPLFEASFLQGWLCRDWTPERWELEMQDMKAAGFRAVILQSCIDLTYEQTVQDAAKTDPSAYTLTSAYALYPTETVPGSEQAHALADALAAAKSTGMQVWIGTVSDSRWWNYGWGIPDAHFAEWSAENAAACGNAVREIAALYGDYAGQIAGIYYHNEIWNFDAACDGSDGGKTAEILAENIRVTLDAAAEVLPDKPLLISPFYNRDLSSAAAYAGFLETLAGRAGLRRTDIVAHQDGAGRDYDTETLSEWAAALYGALRDRVTFWVNNETFRSDMSTLRMADLKADLLATACARRHILFSWNHYCHAAANEANAPFERDFAKLLSVTAGDINDDGECSAADAAALTHWLLHDRIALQNWTAGDLDGSGSLSAADLALLLGRQ